MARKWLFVLAFLVACWPAFAATTAVTSITARDVSTSTPVLLTTGTVSATIAATPGDGVNIAGCKVTQDSTAPDAGSDGWAVASPFSYTMAEGTAEGAVALYGWAKDSADTVAGAAAPYTIYYFAAAPGSEIAKGGMTVTAHSTDGYSPSRMINGLPDDAWRIQNGDPTPWLRIDLGRRYNVSKFIYMGNPGSQNHRMKDYRLYVTDSESPYEADWGTPKTGQFANVPIPDAAAGQWGVPQLAGPAAPTACRYILLRPVNAWAAWPGGSELWAFGTPAPALSRVDSFTAADVDVSRPNRNTLTNGDMVVAIHTVPGDAVTITGYKITINDNVPPDPAGTGWETEITQLILPAGLPEGPLTLYAWARDSSATTWPARRTPSPTP